MGAERRRTRRPLRRVADEGYERVYARVRGRLGDPGSYGHLGRYERELELLDLLEVRPRRPGDCGAVRDDPT